MTRKHAAPRKKQASANINEATLHAVKSQLLSVVGHELRTPINAIVGFSEMLARDDVLPPERRQEYCRTILENANQLQQLIHDMLDAARLEGGTLKLREQDANASDIVATALAQCRTQAEIADVRIVAKLAEHVVLNCDSVRLKQAIFNLLSNAIKFSVTSGIINIEMHKGSMGSFILSVRDAGIGIRPDDLEKVFEPFVQLESGTTRRFGGMGLGLSNARAFARLHGGDIRLESAEGAGTTAQLIIPASRVKWQTESNQVQKDVA